MPDLFRHFIPFSTFQPEVCSLSCPLLWLPSSSRQFSLSSWPPHFIPFLRSLHCIPAAIRPATARVWARLLAQSVLVILPAPSHPRNSGFSWIGFLRTRRRLAGQRTCTQPSASFYSENPQPRPFDGSAITPTFRNHSAP